MQQARGVRSPSLSRAAEAILLWTQEWNISLMTQHVPGCLKVIAVGLGSRGFLRPTEWTLARDVLEPVWNHWFRPMVYLLPHIRSSSPVVSSLQLGTTEHGQVLPEGSLVLCAGLRLPIRLSRKGNSNSKVRGSPPLSLCPWWPAQPWFPELTF